MKYLFFLLTIILVFSGCSVDTSGIYITGNEAQQEELRSIFHTMEKQGHNYESRFILMQRIIQLYQQIKNLYLLNLYLSEYAATYPDDPFNGYYLLLMAYNYKELNAIPFAVHYFERIYRNYSDLEVYGKSIHYICLENLIQHVINPEMKIQYYKDLLSRYTDQIDIGRMYYYIAETYAELGEWELSLQAYKNFTGYEKAVIPENPNAHEQVEEMINYTDLKNKSWIRSDLDMLIAEIKSGIKKRDKNALIRLATRINFFTISWLQDKDQAKRTRGADFSFIDGLNVFMRSRLYYEDQLDPVSNDQEAYLRTWGWSHRISIWYLYFRKINFPADPEIHNKWEWVGIYFGEKDYTGD